MFSIQKTPTLLECSKETLMNAFITCAQYNMFPSSAGGECYVLPYRNKGRMEAQFQLGYQGILTLLYRSGIQSVISEIVYSEDKFSYVNGKIEHEIDIFKSQEQRGEPVGVYVIVTLNGQEIAKAMNKEDVLKFKQYSKSCGEKAFPYSPWNPKNDPELSMWKKTCIKQIAKLLPKNEDLNEAIEKDNKDSNIGSKEIQEKNTEEMIADATEGF